MLARYWLCLVLLNTVGYRGQIAEIMQPQPRWPGQLRDVAGCPAARTRDHLERGDPAVVRYEQQ